MEADLKAHVEKAGAWVEHKKLLVAWHYRLVEKDMKLTLMAKGRVMCFQLQAWVQLKNSSQKLQKIYPAVLVLAQ